MGFQLFKPGDRVQRKWSGRVMIVQKYIKEYAPWVGWHESHNAVECSWYDEDGNYRSEVIHQNNLMKATPVTFAKRRQSTRHKVGR